MDETGNIEADDVDPEIRRFAQALSHGYGQFSNFGGLPLAERRAAAETVRSPWRAGGPAMHRTTDLAPGGARLRIYVPHDAAELPAMLYIHGGGWTMFSVETHDRLMREYAGRAGLIVVGIDYSLSPEAKFPHALGEIVAAIEWLRASGGEHGIDTRTIGIGGDSAGANLAVAASLRLRDDGLPPLAAMLLNYGAFDPRPTTSYPRYDGPQYMLTIAEMELFWSNYLRGPADFNDPLAVPLRANLHALPPAFVTIAECDILADSNRAMAERLAAAGVPVEAHVYPGATHSFLEAVSISALADRALTEASDWLRARLHECGRR